MDLNQKMRYKGGIKNVQCQTVGTKGGTKKSWSIVSNMIKKIRAAQSFSDIYRWYKGYGYREGPRKQVGYLSCGCRTKYKKYVNVLNIDVR